MQCTAEVMPREATSVQASTEAFDFNKYMLSRAQLINKALDAAVPEQYPEVVTGSMR